MTALAAITSEPMCAAIRVTMELAKLETRELEAMGPAILPKTCSEAHVANHELDQASQRIGRTSFTSPPHESTTHIDKAFLHKQSRS